MANYDLSNLALKAVCPGNSILLDNKGLPSVMVRIPKFKISDVITGGSSSTHPAFIVNGVEVPEIYISKFQNVVFGGRAYSLPGEDPAVSLNFDTARTYCEAKGAGWHLMTNAEWAAIALWCRKNSLMPKGNNNYGKDTTESTYVVIPTSTDGANTGRVATGTGPITWSHNAQLNGIWDLNGNVWEWVGGYRTNNGEIQILPNNDAADADNPQNVDSAKWRAILQDGSLANPGAANTLKWDYTADPGTDSASKAFRLNTTVQYPQSVEAPYGAQTFESLTPAGGVTAPEIMKALALFPADAGDHGGDYFYMRTLGERLACRGGGWYHGSSAGVFAQYGNDPRSNVSTSVGFRSAFIPGI
ncbi:MAG: SUMF1/EgtB/PvdO family nonheme iron enzyme [Candidatus Nanoarchaeia archaeon]|nr:SUMF1/EgtB/PvdO family nonheme iron enzyme [Candidatus Nanoarchaeia archaeon]